MPEEDLQVLSFILNDQQYALPIAHIMRVVRMVAVTPAPNTPRMIEGVVNISGNVVPVLNMRARLNFPWQQYDSQNHLIFVRTRMQTLGLIVDQVREVFTLTPAEINPVTELGSDINRFLSAVGKLQDRLLLILDVESLLSIAEEEQLLGAIGETATLGM